MENNRENALKVKSYSFALAIVKFCKSFTNTHKEYVLSKQLLRSGTAIGALIEEANQAESKADFIHKLAVANKEANETHYWLRLIKDSYSDTNADVIPLLNDVDEIIRILIASIKTTKLNK